MITELNYKFVCPDCGHNSENDFIQQLPPRDHLFTCGVCGRCDIAQNEGSDFVQDDVISSGQVFQPSVKEDRPSTYQRRAHITERLSQSLCKEPLIQKSHKELILQAGFKIAQKDPEFKTRVLTRSIKKRDIQKILRALNRKEGTKTFTTRYLEKWKSIRSFLLNEEPPKLPQNKIIRLGYRMQQFSNLWDRKKQDGEFQERKHFPNFNFMFTKLASLDDIQIPIDEFPLPSPQCQQRLEKYFINLATELKFLTPSNK